MIKESRYCNKVVMTIKDDEDFENSAKCWICSLDLQ